MMILLGAVLLALTLAAALYRHRQRRPGDSGRAIGRDMLAGGAIFAFVGPAVGMFAIAVAMSIGTGDPQSLMFALYGLPWAYIFGIVPALLCGMTAGALKPAGRKWPAILRMGVIGAAYAFAFLTTFGSQGRSWAELGFPLFMGAMPGAIAAMVCARILYGKQPKPGTPAAVPEPVESSVGDAGAPTPDTPKG